MGSNTPGTSPRNSTGIQNFISGYREYRQQDKDDYMVNETIPFTHEIILENLLKFTKYSIRVIGYTSIGNGKASDEINCTTFEDRKYNLIRSGRN